VAETLCGSYTVNSMARHDISSHLIHFTRGDSCDEAFERLKTIIAERRLYGTATNIRGGYRCVCFSEAPLASLDGGLVNERYYSSYSLFGVLVSKRWLFELGGRPVIYETEEEYQSLPPSHKWRHVRYDIREGKENIDFTWEREWRVRSDCLEISPGVASVVVPSSEWAQHLVRDHEEWEDYRVRQYSVIMDTQLAEMYREPFKWNLLTLK